MNEYWKWIAPTIRPIVVSAVIAFVWQQSKRMRQHRQRWGFSKGNQP